MTQGLHVRAMRPSVLSSHTPSLRLGAWEERTCSDQILRDRVEKGVPLLLPELSALLSEGTLRHSGVLEGTVWVLQSMHIYDSAGLILL